MRRAVVLSTARWRIDFPGRTHSLDPMSSPPPLVLSKPERAALLRWLQLPSTSPAIALRCRIVLARGEAGKGEKSGCGNSLRLTRLT